MKQTSKKTILGLILVAFTLAFTACTKKLDDKLPDPQSNYNLSKLNTPSDYDGATFAITTGKSLGKPVNSVSAKDPIVERTEDDTKDYTRLADLSNYPLVEYTAPAGLKKIIRDLPFIGRPNTTDAYVAKFELDDKNLSVYIIADRADVSGQFQPIAETLSNGKLKYKIYSVPVDYHRIETVKDAFGKSTNSQQLVSVKFKDEAQVALIDYLDGSATDYLTKIDVFHADLFDGDWFYAETIVSTSDEQNSSLGGASNLSLTLDSSNKVRFIKNSDKIRGVNININEDIDLTKVINLKPVLEIPVKWKEYEIEPDGTVAGNGEREVEKTNWQDRKWAQYDFTRVRSGLLENQAASALNNRQLVNFQIGNDYRSYTIYLVELNIKVKHSFKRVRPTNYVAKQAHKKDMRQFGYFKTIKPYLQNFKIHRPEDIDKRTFVNRFNTKSGVIKYYFTEQTPEIYRQLGRDAKDAWNETFAKAGLDVRIDLDETKDVKLGDIRYNAINIIQSASTGGGALGFGPSIADPETGEIISATSNLWVTNTEDGIIRFIRNYIRQRIGLIDKNGFIGVSSPTLDIADSLIAPSLSSSGQYQSALPSDVYKIAEKASSPDATTEDFAHLHPEKIFKKIQAESLKEKEIVRKKLEPIYGSMTEQIMEQNPHFAMKRAGLHSGRELAMGVSHADTTLLLKDKCPEVETYISDLETEMKNNPNQTYLTGKEHDLLQNCAYKIGMNKALGTLVHEIGHNLGLRHNFMGSNDADNFMTPEESESLSLVESSSTMEYPSFGAHRLKKPGLYDIAAIQFGYGDSVQLANGSSLKLDTSLDIEQNLAQAQAVAKPYKFCTDENATRYAGQWWASVLDPKCALWDKGVTASEIVVNYMHEFDTSLAISNFRHDKYWRKFLDDTGSFKALNRMRAMVNSKMIYDEWRIILSNYLKIGDEYLENLDAQSYQALMQEMSQDPKFAEAFKEYKPASEIAFSFLNQVAFMSNKYCVFKNSDSDFDVVELAEVRQQIYHDQKISVTSCKEDVALSYITENYGELIFSVGHEDKDTRLSLAPIDLTESNDVSGTEFDKLIARNLLAGRTYYTLKHEAKNFIPNFYDEPIYRSILQNTILNRLINGVNVSALKQNIISTDVAQKSVLPLLEMTEQQFEEQLDSALINQIVEQDKDKPDGLKRNAEFEVQKIKEDLDLYNSIKLQFLGQINPNLDQVLQVYTSRKNFIKFKHENQKGLLAMMFQSLQQGFFIPGKQNISSQRATLFGAFQTDDQNVIAQSPASLPLGGGRAIVVSSPNSLIGIMINKYNEIAVLQQTKAISAETIAKVDALKTLIPEATHSMQEHFDFAAKLTELLPTIESPALQQMIQQQFQTVLGVVGYYQQQGLEKEALDELMKADAVETYAALTKELQLPQELQFSLTTELTKPFFDSYQDNHAKMLRDLERNKEDYKAQSDLLISIIFASAG